MPNEINCICEPDRQTVSNVFLDINFAKENIN